MKILSLILLTFSLLFLFTTKSSAFTVETQGQKSEPTQTLILLANPPTRSTALQIRLSVEGGKVISFSPSNDGLLSIGTCDSENSTFTERSVCVDLATTSSIVEEGQIIGVLTVERDSNTTQLRLIKEEGNAYLNSSGELVQDNGLAFSLYGQTTRSHSKSSSGESFLILATTFLVGVVLGTTLTTFAHVLQHDNLKKKS